MFAVVRLMCGRMLPACHSLLSCLASLRLYNILPLGHIRDVMLVSRKGNIEKDTLTVLQYCVLL